MLRRALRDGMVTSCTPSRSHGHVAGSSLAARCRLAAASAHVTAAPLFVSAALLSSSSSSSSSASSYPLQCQVRRAFVVPSGAASTDAAVTTATTVPTPAAACPYHRQHTTGTNVVHGMCAAATPTATAATTRTATPTVPRCPVVGTTVPLSCPVEAGYHGTAATMHTQPTLAHMTLVLGKSQLSLYVAATALAGFVLGGGTSIATAAAVTVGTLLQSFSANTANQIIETPYDARMKRTCRRPLPMRHITPRAATMLSAGELVAGTAVLYSISPAAAALGVVNWLLYVTMYTPLKRVSALNTWFGSIVGGVPPLMGGVAATGGVLTGPVLLLGSLLFVWQIPHFNGLAFHCRRDYEAAGYRMLAFYNPWRASFYAVALSVVAAAITLLGPVLVDMPVEAAWYYPVTVVANALMVYKAVLFHRAPQLHCRGCFVFSYVYLSIMLAAVMINHVQPLHQIDRAVTYVLRWQRGDAAEHDARTRHEQGTHAVCASEVAAPVPLLPVQ